MILMSVMRHSWSLLSKALLTNFGFIMVPFADPEEGMDPKEVLVAMREYVRHFLGCRECANHFTTMASNVENEIANEEQQVLWLWRGHNNVNQRLKGDDSEDPRHPKIQFPSKEACPDCKKLRHSPYGTTEVFDNSKVLEYLQNFYSADNILGVSYSETSTASSWSQPTGSLLCLFMALFYICFL